MANYKGKIVTISGFGYNSYQLKEIGFYWTDEMLEPIKFTKNDFQNLDVVILRNGDKLLYTDYGNVFIDVTEENSNEISFLNDFSKDLKHKEYEQFDIIKVERPSYSTVYERKEEPKEVTMEELQKILGYEVKIIKKKEDD